MGRDFDELVDEAYEALEGERFEEALEIGRQAIDADPDAPAGHYLAGTTRGEMHRGAITFGAAGAARAWFTSDGNAFIRNHAAKRHPFFFVLDTADTDFDDARYLRVTDDARIERLAVGGAWSRLSFNLPVEEAYMEPVPA